MLGNISETFRARQYDQKPENRATAQGEDKVVCSTLYNSVYLNGVQQPHVTYLYPTRRVAGPDT